MRKKLLFAPLWGIFTLSLLSSCRTEDSAVTQKQIEDKRFAVFVPKDGKVINYIDGFAYLMKRYDKVQNTNISGLNNTIVINNLTASINKRPLALTLEKGDTYVEFNIRTEMITEENGDKSIIYPKVRGNKVIGLVEAVLTKQETHMSYYTYNSESSLYKDYKDDFQDALDRYQNRRQIRLSASIKPMADTEIEGVVITVKRKKKEDIGTVRPPEEGGSCPEFANCIAYNPGGGGGNDMPSPENVDEIVITDLKAYPCAFAVAQQLPNLDNNIAKLLRDTFGVNENINVTFKADPNMSPIDDGETVGKGNVTSQKLSMTISLNANMLQTATKEYILVTMYHEVIHAYLSYQRLVLGKESFEEKYPKIDCYDVTNSKGEVTQRFTFINNSQTDGHPRFTSFIDSLENAISTYNPSLSKDIVKAMARAGIFSDLSDSEIVLNQNERDTSKGLSKGTSCP
ncbi:hypothetical protein [Elizabethkingia miricola]|uniref:SprT-like family protein n=3 Tax=Bacteria TaxID=2 RepID=A0ABD5B5R2_ELIMR|nr:hypothetical protein [Elizabethkingia miricola]MDQ8749001.1 hypothetical protein [Elizabethkingia miricola]